MNSSDSKPIEDVLVDLSNSSVPELVARYEVLFGRSPRSKHRRWLVNRLAWQEQAIRFGGLSGAAKRRIAEIQAELQLPGLGTPVERRVAKRTRVWDPPVGTRLDREWRGKTVVATRVDGGWEADGVVHRSLSGAAKAITGSHVSGPAFFRITRRGGR